MGIQDLLHWWNLIYAAPLAISLVWILTTVCSGMHGHGDAGHDIGHHIGNVGHDVAHSLGGGAHHGDVGASHAGGDHGAAHGHDAHGDHDQDGSGRLMALLGIERVPISLLIGVFLLCWGAFGLMSNQVFGILHYPAVYIWPSLGVTFVASTIATRLMAAVFARIMPGDETYGVSRTGLVGSLGRSIYPVSESAGTVDVKDHVGTVHRVQAKTEPGKGGILAGKDVIVLDFDEEDKRFVVRESTI